MGFSRQEPWSRLPCPPAGDVPDPGMEPASLMSLALTDRFFTTSTTWEALCFSVKVKVTQLCLTLCDPMNYTVHEILQARILEWVAFPFSRGSSQSGIEPRSPTLQGDSPAEPQGKPKNTGVGSLSFLQQIFQTQELNQGLLPCRQILYQLSYIVKELIISVKR